MEKEKQTERYTPQQSNKKQKTVPDLNRKPKEERHQKYYWPKIDVDKKRHPKPKTPKPETPKPKTPKLRKKYSKKEDHAIQPETPVQVLKVGSTCKQALNFNNANLYGLEFDMGLDSLSCGLETMNTKLVSLVENIGEADQTIPTLETPSPKTPTRVLSFTETTNHLTCKRALNFKNGHVYGSMEKCVVRFGKVYQRRLYNTCLRTCQKLGLSVRKIYRRKRDLRKRISSESLKQLGGFNEFAIDKDVLNRIAIVRCNRTMLFPMKEKVDDIALELFNCVLSLVSSSLTFRKRRRTVKTIACGTSPILASLINGTSESAYAHNEVHNSPACPSLANNLTMKDGPFLAPFDNGPSGDVHNELQNPTPYSPLATDLSMPCRLLLAPPENGTSDDLHNGGQNSMAYSSRATNLAMIYRPLLGPPENGTSGDAHKGGQNSMAYSSRATNLAMTYSPLLAPPENGTSGDVDNGGQNSIAHSSQATNLAMTDNPPLVSSANGTNEDVHYGLQNSVVYLSSTTNLTDHFTSEGGKPGPKQKKRRPYKSRTKRVDYFSGITDWRDESLERFMDPLINQFKSMELYDNPMALERWTVQFTKEDDKGEGLGNIKWEEERRALLQRIAKFIYVMTRSQGSRDFVKWNGSVLDSVVGVFLTQNVSDVLSSNAYMELGSRYPIKSSITEDENTGDLESNNGQGPSCGATPNVVIEHPEEEETTTQEEELRSKDFDDALNEMLEAFSDLNKKGKSGEEAEKIDWEAIRIKYVGEGQKQRSHETRDSVDWEAVRKAPVEDIAKAIHGRGQHRIIAEKIQSTLNRILKDHGSLDLEWLRELPATAAKAYLLSFYGLGLKSVECLRLLTLHHHAFPVDVNIARIVIRLGWVPIKPLPMGLHFHLLVKYPLENEIQKYLWPRLSHLDQRTLYKLHYHMITFGKVFCMKKRPNCAACPFKTECKYYASVVASKLPLPSGQKRTTSKSKRANNRFIRNPFFDVKTKSRQNYSLLAQDSNSSLDILPYLSSRSKKCEPIVEMPPSPERQEADAGLTDIEDLFTHVNDEAHNDDEEISEIKLNTEEFRQTLRNYFEENNIPFGGNDYLSNALVSLSPEDASVPLPKHMFVARLRTEHQVYELPDYHPLLKDLDRRDEKDPLPYLLATWLPVKPGNVSDSLKDGGACIEDDPCCSSRDDNSLTVPGTILIPSRTAMGGSFALNGTYFQVNEVFADDESSQCPIDVPRAFLWNLRRRTLYCGSSTSSIFRGLTWEEIRRCCCEGFICTRGFNRKTRAPKPLPKKFHNRQKGKAAQLGDEDEE